MNFNYINILHLVDNNFNGWYILWLVLGIVIGGVATFFITRHLFNKQLKENPPISEKQIRAMFIAMGQKPSEAKVQQVLKSMGIAPTQSSNSKKSK